MIFSAFVYVWYGALVYFLFFAIARISDPMVSTRYLPSEVFVALS